MSTTTIHPVAADYLRRLERAARRLPRAERRELVDEIRSHIAEAIDVGMSDAEVLTVLDRLGEPEDIVEAQRPHAVTVETSRGTHEWAAIFLLLLGGFVFGVGWIAGLILLLSSRAWTTLDKWIGTLVVPGGLAAAVLAFGIGTVTISGGCTGGTGRPEHCTGGPGTVEGILLIALLAFVVLAPFCTAVYLARRAR
jgi:uncharacterized membrane protein